MIVVTGIKTVLVDDSIDNRARVMNRNATIAVEHTFETPHEAPIRVTTEMIDGKVFKNAHGWPITIGWDKAAQESLGLPFKHFEEQESKIRSLQRQLDAANHLVRKYRDQCSRENSIMETFARHQANKG